MVISISKTLVRGHGVTCLLDSLVISGKDWVKLFTGPVFSQPVFLSSFVFKISLL